jgi:hypothetical protein
MLTARTLDLGAADTEMLFCEEVYRELGFFDLYKIEKRRLLAQFAMHEIDLNEEFARWERQGDFVYVCHHPKPVVMIDILRRSLLGRYLDVAGFHASAEIATTQVDHFAGTEVWPIYPELAVSLGFQGSLTWVRPAKLHVQKLSLREVIDATFMALDNMSKDWRSCSL